MSIQKNKPYKKLLKPVPSLARIASPTETTELIKKDRISAITLRIPTSCNLDCVYCFGAKEQYEKLIESGKALTYKEIINILDQSFELGVNNVSIVGDGEPLMYKVSEGDIYSLINYINDHGAQVILFTNTSLITKKVAESLFNKNVVIVGKQNSLKPAIQNQLAGKAWAYKKLQQGLHNLIKAGFNKTEPSRLAVNTVICRQNYDEIPSMWRQWREQNIIPYVHIYVPPVDKVKQKIFMREYYVSPQKVKHLFYRLRDIDEKEFSYTWDPDKTYPIVALGCTIVLSGLGMAPNGDIQMCSHTDDPIVNVRSKSLKSILHSKEVRKIRRYKYSKDDFHFGCRALTFALTEDRLAKDPFYWEK